MGSMPPFGHFNELPISPVQVQKRHSGEPAKHLLIVTGGPEGFRTSRFD